MYAVKYNAVPRFVVVYSFDGGGGNSTGGKVEVRKAGAGSRRVNIYIPGVS